MKELKVQVVNRLGLHARAAARFVHLAGTFESRITVAADGTRVDGKSILGLLTLAVAKGADVVLSASGSDEDDALAALSELIAGRFGEDS